MNMLLERASNFLFDPFSFPKFSTILTLLCAPKADL